MRTLITILGLTQDELRDYIKNACKDFNYALTGIKGNLIYTPKGCLKYPLLCSHMDTINDAYRGNAPQVSDLLFRDETIQLRDTSECTCLGGDDRLGVWVALKLMAKGMPYGFAFFRDEEIGCKGSSASARFVDKLPITCFIGLDRRGFNEMATYGYDNLDLLEIFSLRGYKEAQGSITDASNLSSSCTKNRACLNLSVGYWNEHTRDEFILLSPARALVSVLGGLGVVNALTSRDYEAELFYDDSDWLSYNDSVFDSDNNADTFEDDYYEGFRSPYSINNKLYSYA